MFLFALIDRILLKTLNLFQFYANLLKTSYQSILFYILITYTWFYIYYFFSISNYLKEIFKVFLSYFKGNK
jgi:hypothetical protein